MIDKMDRLTKVKIVYEARRDRKIHPYGKFDNAQRWYPDEDLEGGTPPVRSPSRSYPYSYMVACRTHKWVSQLPDSTLDMELEHLGYTKSVLKGVLG